MNQRFIKTVKNTLTVISGHLGFLFSKKELSCNFLIEGNKDFLRELTVMVDSF